MSKSKDEMLKIIHAIEADIKPIFAEAKIKDNHLELPENANELPATMIRAGLKWLEEIHTKEYAAVKTVKRLLPDEIWKRYEQWEGFSDHQEVVLLKEKMVLFRKVVVSRNRPDLFKKGIVNEFFKKKSKDTKKGAKS